MYAIFIRFITHIKKRRSVIRYLSCDLEALGLPLLSQIQATQSLRRICIQSSRIEYESGIYQRRHLSLHCFELSFESS